MSVFSVRQVESVVLWLWITPLGLPVVPDVKAIRITSFAPCWVLGGATALAVDDGHAIGMGRGAAGEDRVERLGAPVSGLLVPLDELVAEPCLEAHADQPPRYAALTCGLSRSIAAEPLSTIRPVSMT